LELHRKRSIGEYAEVDNEVQEAITIYDGEKEFIYLPQIQPTNETTTQSRQKLKPICDLFIEHLPKPVTLVMKEVEQEDEATIMPKMKLLSLIRTEGSDRQLLISR
jgi:hypothetical protein